MVAFILAVEVRVSEKVYDIVFEGGGARGVVHLGAIRAFEEAGLLPGRVVATSAGAIGAALLAAGYDSHAFEAALFAEVRPGVTAFATFLDPIEQLTDEQVEASAVFRALDEFDMPFIGADAERRLDLRVAKAIVNSPGLRHYTSLNEWGGVCAGEGIFQNVQRWLAQAPGGRDYSQATLGELYAATGRHLTVVATDVTVGRMLALNHVTAPDVPVAWAVRMSVAIPFVYQEVRWRSAWGQYLGQELAGNVVVDGGALSNFPLGLVLGRGPDIERIMGPVPPGEPRAVGLDIMPSMEVDENTLIEDATVELARRNPKKGLVSSPIIDRGLALIAAMMNARDRESKDAHRASIVRLPAAGFSVTDFDMNKVDRERLIAAGHRAMSAWLRERGLDGAAD